MNCVFAGTFDPLTAGHENVIKKCLEVYPRVLIVAGENAEKTPFFSLAERMNILNAVYGGEKRVKVAAYRDCAERYADFLKENGVTVYVRGIRSEKDREYENAAISANAALYPFVKTVFFSPDAEFSGISSSIVRERIKNGADFSDLLSEKAYNAVKAVLAERAERLKNPL